MYRRKQFLATFLAVTAGACTIHAAEFFVSPGGSPFGDGSLAAPWDLPTALAHPSTVHPGDTIWLRGGTYTGTFHSTLTGASGQPIIVRQFPGERATLDYASTAPTEVQVLKIDGAWTWYWGMEVMSSWTQAGCLGFDVIVRQSWPGQCENPQRHDEQS